MLTPKAFGPGGINVECIGQFPGFRYEGPVLPSSPSRDGDGPFYAVYSTDSYFFDKWM